MAKRKITRRQFVTTTLAAGAGSVLPGKTSFGFPGKSVSRFADPFKIIKLRKSGIKSTLLGMVTGFIGYNRSSNITRAGVAESIIRQAYEKGIRFIDCADGYGTHPYTALKYVLGLGTVDMIIVGFELPEQIDNYIGRVRKVQY